MNIDMYAFAKRLEAAILARGLVALRLKISPYRGGGVHAEVDGDACITNIGLWPNGLLDVEYISLPAEERTFIHREIQSEDDALNSFIEEVNRAIARSGVGSA